MDVQVDHINVKDLTDKEKEVDQYFITFFLLLISVL